MKKLNKLFALVLLLCFALGCLVACVKPGNEDPCKDGHTEEVLSAVAATCTQTGLTEGKKCTVCGKVLTEQQVVPTLPHNYKEGVCTVCGAKDPNYQPPQQIDYVSQLKLDENSETKKLKVTVKNYIDGDTTHFNANDPTFEGGVLKARYLAINTPESTGKIEDYGKTASKFTKSKLQGAEEIMVESDDANWNADSTGSRYLVWVWYKQDGVWRNLNLEILQNGLAIASNTAQNRYGEICVNALNQAKSFKLLCHSGKPDPDTYHGAAVELTLKELRANIASYNGIKVAFEGVVAADSGSQGVYVQEFDEETGEFNGVYVYYGATASGPISEALCVGNRVRIVGVCTFYETGGTYQVSGLSYRTSRPNDPGNTQLIATNQEIVYTKVTADQFVNGQKEVEVITEDEDGNETSTHKTMPYAEFIYNTAVEMDNLKVVRVYTTNNEGSSSNGAMTLTCEVDGLTITIRTIVLYDDQKQLVTADYFEGKTINVKGVVESFNGEYQIKLLTLNNVTIVD